MSTYKELQELQEQQERQELDMKTLAVISLIILCVALSVALFHTKTKPTVTFLNSGAVANPSLKLPFSEAVSVAETIYLSGQIGVIPQTLTLVEGGIEAETLQTMNNIKSTLEANGLAMRNIVKCTIMLADLSEWSKFNNVYTTFFKEPYPARSALGVNGLALGAKVEIECLAVDH